jgi:hypothetical protein
MRGICSISAFWLPMMSAAKFFTNALVASVWAT